MVSFKRGNYLILLPPVLEPAMAARGRVAAFGLHSQGCFGEEGSAKQGEDPWFNLPVLEGWYRKRRLAEGITMGQSGSLRISA